MRSAPGPAPAESLSIALEAARAGAWDWVPSTGELHWSPECWDLYGLDRSVRPSLDAWASSIHPDDRESTARVVRDVVAAGAPISMEWRVALPGGEERWLVARGRPVPDERGRGLRYIGISLDLTDLRKAQAEIAEIQGRYRDLVETSSELVQVVSVPDGRLLLTNRAWQEAFGFSADEASRMTVFDILPPEWVPELRGRLDRLARGESGRVLERGEPERGFELPLVARGGRVLSASGSLVPRIVDGRVVALQAFFRDVTAQRRAERLRQTGFEVARVLARAVTLDEAMPPVLAAVGAGLSWEYAEVHVAGPDGRLVAVASWHDGSPEMRRLAEGAGALDEDESGDVGRLLGGVDALWAEGLVPRCARSRLAAAQGIVTAVVVPLVAEDRRLGILLFGSRKRRPREDDTVSLVEDVAAQLAQFVARVRSREELAVERDRLAERVAERTAELQRLNVELAGLNLELSRASRLKDEFLASMSHELRTPLNAILGLSEALAEQVYGPVPEDQRGALRMIDENGRQLLALINDILDLSNLQAGRVTLDREAFEAAPLCHVAMRMVRDAAQRKGLQVSIRVEPPTCPSARTRAASSRSSSTCSRTRSSSRRRAPSASRRRGSTAASVSS
ncbi:MAG: histidine kinase dimerization/phospho-acceptor domain-containing protein [Vicinamibacteria bacterium]